MRTILLTIILPCYNVSKFLNRSLDSIFSQNIKYTYEVIAVDDGSTDNTPCILNKYSVRHPELKIIRHDINKKLTGARTTGMLAAKGKYVMHMDPDDYLLPNTLSSIFENNGFDWDILIANFRKETFSGVATRYVFPKPYFNMTIKQDRKIIFKQISKGSCFAKIIKKSLLNNLQYYQFNYNIGEDKAFNVEIFSRAKIIKFDSRNMYFYAMNANSLDRGKFNSKIMDWSNCWQHNIINLIDNNLLSKEGKYYCIKEIERNNVGMLLKFEKQQNVEKLFIQWKEFMIPQIRLFGIRKHLYALILKINSFKIAKPILLTIPLQWNPIRERLYSMLNK